MRYRGAISRTASRQFRFSRITRAQQRATDWHGCAVARDWRCFTRRGRRDGRLQRLILFGGKGYACPTTDTAVPRQEARHDGSGEEDGSCENGREEVGIRLEEFDAGEEATCKVFCG
jgi:hypothetical protein